jgi:gas vesicle protein
MEDDNKLSYFFLGLGLGVAVGVLFAPKSGNETRQFLRSKAEEGGEYVKQQADTIKETAAEALERSKQTIQKHKDNLASAVEAGKQAYREATAPPGDLFLPGVRSPPHASQQKHGKPSLDYYSRGLRSYRGHRSVRGSGDAVRPLQVGAHH